MSTRRSMCSGDPGNPEMIKGLIDMLIPFPAFSTPIGDQVNAVVEANLPMNAGCTGFPPCPDLSSLTNVMFRVPPRCVHHRWRLHLRRTGHADEQPGQRAGRQWNFDLGQTGDPVPWYAQTVKIDPLESVRSTIDYLTGTPGTVTIPTGKEIVDTYAAFAKSPGTACTPSCRRASCESGPFGLGLRHPALLQAAVPSCNSYDPFMPVGWEPGGWVPDAFTYVPTSRTTHSSTTRCPMGPIRLTTTSAIPRIQLLRAPQL